MSVTTTVKTDKPATFKLLDGVSAIEKAIASIKTRGQSLQRDIHVAACSILAHVGQHHDVRMVSKLLEAMPDMSRRNAVKAWFESFGPIAFDDKGQVKYNPATRLLLGDAMAKPFWSFKPEAEYVPLEIGKAFDSFIKRLEKDAKETGRNHAAIVQAMTMLRDKACPEETTAPAPVLALPAPTREETNAKLAEASKAARKTRTRKAKSDTQDQAAAA